MSPETSTDTDATENITILHKQAVKIWISYLLNDGASVQVIVCVTVIQILTAVAFSSRFTKEKEVYLNG